MPLQLVTIFKMFTCYTLQQKMCMAKNGFSTTTVWSVGNSEAFKVCTRRVGACHPKRCTMQFFDVVPKYIRSKGLTRIPAIIKVHYKYIHKNLSVYL